MLNHTDGKAKRSKKVGKKMFHKMMTFMQVIQVRFLILWPQTTTSKCCESLNYKTSDGMKYVKQVKPLIYIYQCKSQQLDFFSVNLPTVRSRCHRIIMYNSKVWHIHSAHQVVELVLKAWKCTEEKLQLFDQVNK